MDCYFGKILYLNCKFKNGRVGIFDLFFKWIAFEVVCNDVGVFDVVYIG